MNAEIFWTFVAAVFLSGILIVPERRTKMDFAFLFASVFLAVLYWTEIF